MRKTVTVIVATAALLSVFTVGAALGSGRFVDVPADHPHAADIEWATERGITKGCNPPANDQFCPDEPVTRAQMVTMLKRYSDWQDNRADVAFRWQQVYRSLDVLFAAVERLEEQNAASGS